MSEQPIQAGTYDRDDQTAFDDNNVLDFRKAGSYMSSLDEGRAFRVAAEEAERQRQAVMAAYEQDPTESPQATLILLNNLEAVRRHTLKAA